MTEHDGGTDGTDRRSRSWKIPSRIYGRVRTSTVALGICFVLTALLYNQVRPEPAEVQGPQPVDTSQYTGVQPNYQSEYTEPSTTTPPSSTVDPSNTEDPSNTGATPGEPGSSGSSTSSESGTQEPTFLPGVPVPPQLRSLFPSEPSATPSP
ncbi:hypothetical protein [Rhodococcus sovatensis]|uniref:Uncharacterized protein n=1 Tax=Rhodococcus sovatensis TaxID=1805840 RepID=A0ABZ2PPY1_9NOCA